MTQKWKRLLKALPGYDPLATAGDCHFDEAAAQLALDFFPGCLTHVKGEWAGPPPRPFKLVRWEQSVIANTFGWKRPDGTRRYRKVFIGIPRKNGKTCFAAGIALYMLFVEAEPGSENYSAASDKDQASLVFQQAEGMVRQDEELFDRATIYTKSIVLKDGTGSYKPISSDVNSKWGYNTQSVIIDELHAHRTRDVVDALVTSTGARRQPLVVYITTSDWDHPSICNETWDYARAVRDGLFNDASARAFLPAIWETAEGDDWQKVSTWRKANPNLGVSLHLEYLQEEFQRAKRNPEYENTFRRMHLNERTGQATRWLQLEHWDACRADYMPEDLQGEECWGGLDLASTTDLCALALWFPRQQRTLFWFWAPQERAKEREDSEGAPYRTWAKQGYMELTPGDVTDYSFIRKALKQIAQDYDLKQLGYDPFNARQFALQLQDEDGLPMIEFRQGWMSMNEPCKKLEALVHSHQLEHDGSLVMRWMASNVAIRANPDNNIRFDKAKSGDKIDGMVALAMGIGCWLSGAKEEESVYKTRGILRL